MKRLVILLAGAGIALSAMCADSPVASISKPNATTNAPPDETKSPECGDPVGVFTGSAYETAEDLRVVCPDLDLVMFRSYSSGSMDEGSLGFGWTHAYDWRVVPDGARVVVHASGERGPSDRVHLFGIPAPGGSVWNADGYELRLSSGGLWTVVSPEALAYSFDAAGRLESLTTWNGTRVEISRDAEGRVTRAQHSCGKSLVFEYGADGLLSRVSTPDPAVAADYSYESHGGWKVLASVVRSDHGRPSVNRYAYSQSPSPGVRRIPGIGETRVPQRLSPKAKVRRPVMTGKRDANGIEGSFDYIRPDDSAHVWCARTSLSDGLFETHLSFGEDGTEVASPYAGGIARTLYGRDGLWREIFRRTGAETLSKTYDPAGLPLRAAERTQRPGHTPRLSQHTTRDTAPCP